MMGDLADPARFELTTSAFGGQRSIGLLARRHSPESCRSSMVAGRQQQPLKTTTQIVTITECRSRRLRARYRTRMSACWRPRLSAARAFDSWPDSGSKSALNVGPAKLKECYNSTFCAHRVACLKIRFSQGSVRSIRTGGTIAKT
jgi:hypothetical protein